MGITGIIQGIAVGIAVSAPIGPVGILCIQKTINKGRNYGLASGLGATLADTFYAIVAGFGLTMISNFLIDQQFYMRVFGGGLLILMGIKMFMTNTVKQVRSQQNGKNKSLLGDFVSVFLLTVSNPLTIIAFGAIFAGMGFVAEESGFFSVLYLVLGVFLGAGLWWGGLVMLVYIFRHKFRLKRLYWINKLGGVGVVIFGIAAIVSMFV